MAKFWVESLLPQLTTEALGKVPGASGVKEFGPDEETGKHFTVELNGVTEENTAKKLIAKETSIPITLIYLFNIDNAKQSFEKI